MCLDPVVRRRCGLGSRTSVPILRVFNTEPHRCYTALLSIEGVYCQAIGLSTAGSSRRRVEPHQVIPGRAWPRYNCLVYRESGPDSMAEAPSQCPYRSLIGCDTAAQVLCSQIIGSPGSSCHITARGISDIL
jgi:hypothetical protein